MFPQNLNPEQKLQLIQEAKTWLEQHLTEITRVNSLINNLIRAEESEIEPVLELEQSLLNPQLLKQEFLHTSRRFSKSADSPESTDEATDSSLLAQLWQQGDYSKVASYLAQAWAELDTQPIRNINWHDLNRIYKSKLQAEVEQLISATEIQLSQAILAYLGLKEVEIKDPSSDSAVAVFQQREQSFLQQNKFAQQKLISFYPAAVIEKLTKTSATQVKQSKLNSLNSASKSSDLNGISSNSYSSPAANQLYGATQDLASILGIKKPKKNSKAKSKTQDLASRWAMPTSLIKREETESTSEQSTSEQSTSSKSTSITTTQGSAKTSSQNSSVTQTTKSRRETSEITKPESQVDETPWFKLATQDSAWQVWDNLCKQRIKVSCDYLALLNQQQTIDLQALVATATSLKSENSENYDLLTEFNQLQDKFKQAVTEFSNQEVASEEGYYNFGLPEYLCLNLSLPIITNQNEESSSNLLNQKSNLANKDSNDNKDCFTLNLLLPSSDLLGLAHYYRDLLQQTSKQSWTNLDSTSLFWSYPQVLQSSLRDKLLEIWEKDFQTFSQACLRATQEVCYTLDRELDLLTNNAEFEDKLEDDEFRSSSEELINKASIVELLSSSPLTSCRKFPYLQLPTIIENQVHNSLSNWKPEIAHHLVWRQLANQFGLLFYPNQIHCFDVSHSNGFYAKASAVAANEFTLVYPEAYRHLNLDEVTPGDDYGAMELAVTKRYHSCKNLTDLPNLIIIDGGEKQLGKVLPVMAKLQEKLLSKELNLFILCPELLTDRLKNILSKLALPQTDKLSQVLAYYQLAVKQIEIIRSLLSQSLSELSTSQRKQLKESVLALVYAIENFSLLSHEVNLLGVRKAEGRTIGEEHFLLTSVSKNVSYQKYLTLNYLALGISTKAQNHHAKYKIAGQQIVEVNLYDSQVQNLLLKIRDNAHNYANKQRKRKYYKDSQRSAYDLLVELPDIGSTTAKKLLEQFTTLDRLATRLSYHLYQNPNFLEKIPTEFRSYRRPVLASLIANLKKLNG